MRCNETRKRAFNCFTVIFCFIPFIFNGICLGMSY